MRSRALEALWKEVGDCADFRAYGGRDTARDVDVELFPLGLFQLTRMSVTSGNNVQRKNSPETTGGRRLLSKGRFETESFHHIPEHESVVLLSLRSEAKQSEE